MPFSAVSRLCGRSLVDWHLHFIHLFETLQATNPIVWEIIEFAILDPLEQADEQAKREVAGEEKEESD